MRKNIIFICLTAANINTAFGLLKDVGGRIPMIDGNKLPLTVDLDVSEFNRKLQKVVEEDLVDEVEGKFKHYINSSDFNDMIQTTFIHGMTTILKNQIDFIVERKVSELMKDQNLKIQQLNDAIAEDQQTYPFFATLSTNNINVAQGSVLIFDKLQLNVGGHYNVSTGKYTCPKSGLYTFSWTTMSNEKKDCTSDLMVNGKTKARNAVDNDVTGDSLSGSVTTVVRMERGQTAWIKVVDGNYFRGVWGSVSVSVFSGYRIQ